MRYHSCTTSHFGPSFADKYGLQPAKPGKFYVVDGVIILRCNHKICNKIMSHIGTYNML
jgi:hypothetical protein